MAEDYDPEALESAFEDIALELLGGMFPRVDVASYYRAAVKHVEDDIRGHRDQVRIVGSMDAFSRLWYVALNRVASAYVLITGRRDEEGVDRLMGRYEALMRIYLEDRGLITRAGG